VLAAHSRQHVRRSDNRRVDQFSIPPVLQTASPRLRARPLFSKAPGL
jgi:hypothetical protein